MSIFASRLRCSSLVSGLLAAALLCSGCAASFGPSANVGFGVDLDRPEMRQFAVASGMTEVERDVRIASGPPDRREVTPVLMWTGIGVGTVAAGASVGFGIAGYVAKNQLADGYAGGGLNGEQRDDLITKGERRNNLAVATASIAVIGYALAVVSAAVDWNRCGPLAKKKRHCREAGR